MLALILIGLGLGIFWFAIVDASKHAQLTVKKYLKLYGFLIQWNVRDVVASILQDIARWVAP